MTILLFEPEKVYHVRFFSVFNQDGGFYAHGTGRDGALRSLAKVVDEYLQGCCGDGRGLEYATDIAFFKHQLNEIQAKETKTPHELELVDELKRDIEATRFIAPKADFVTEVACNVSAGSEDSWTDEDYADNGVEGLFAPGVPRDALHLLYGFANAVPYWQLEISSS